MSSKPPNRARRLAGRIAYWVAVVVIALALVVAFILFLESRDKSTIDARPSALTPTHEQSTDGSSA